ncbi:hypothetical protein Bbelb_120230 [Branchiostoma belcheri]|nr:hypothetical protein Bbelb_120230 [Branchiostoma belcheri]
MALYLTFPDGGVTPTEHRPKTHYGFVHLVPWAEWFVQGDQLRRDYRCKHPNRNQHVSLDVDPLGKTDGQVCGSQIRNLLSTLNKSTRGPPCQLRISGYPRTDAQDSAERPITKVNSRHQNRRNYRITGTAARIHNTRPGTELPALRDGVRAKCKKQPVKTLLIPGRGSNSQPPGPQSDTLTARPKRSRPIGRVSW